MYKLTIIAIGKLKESYWKDAVAEYKKRLGPYAKVEVIEVPDGKTVKAEANALRKRIHKDAYVIALDLSGKECASEKLAQNIKREGERGRELTFVIGGPHGLDPEFVKEADAVFALSRLTFTHGQARAILFEQLYRAMTILAGKTYHY